MGRSKNIFSVVILFVFIFISAYFPSFAGQCFTSIGNEGFTKGHNLLNSDTVPAIIGIENPSVQGIWKLTYSPDKSAYTDTDPAAFELKNAYKSQWTWQMLIPNLKAKKMLAGDISGDDLLEVIIHFDDDVLGYYSFATGSWSIIINNCFDFTVARTAPDIPKKVIFSITQGVYVWDYDAGFTRLYNVPAEIIIAADLYRDGLDELLIGFSALPNLYVYSFATTSHSVIAGIKPSQMVTGDLTGDGHNELVCVFQGLGIYIFRNIADKGQHTHEGSDDTAIFNIFSDVPQNHRWVSVNKSWQVQRITYIEPMPGHSMALGNIAFTNAKELLFAFNNRTYYYSYGNGFYTLVFAPMKTIIAGRFTGQARDYSKDNLITCQSPLGTIYIYHPASNTWERLVNAGNANVMITYGSEQQYESTRKIPWTGQSEIYRAGDDGYYQMGHVWPEPRFTDHGNLTVTDNLTGLMWTKDANMAGQHIWVEAIEWCNTLVHAEYSDWRLPNLNELWSLFDVSTYYPALPTNHPFINVQTDIYWSSTTWASDPANAWRMRIGSSGNVWWELKSSSRHVWAVRGNSTGPAQVARTGQTTIWSLGDDGYWHKGHAGTTPRYIDNGDGSVTDRDTGLIWSKDGNIAGLQTWGQAIDLCNDLDYAGYSDWRLPNVRELQSMIDYANTLPAISTGNPFTDIQEYRYWTSTTLGGNSNFAWFVYIPFGSVDLYSKGNNAYVWPVRGGGQ